MTTVLDPRLATHLRRAAVQATRAPSVHNTQPWHFTVSGDALEMRADMSRRLQVLDPHARQLMLSCGCALLNARAVLAQAGYSPYVYRFPEPRDDPSLFARVHVDTRHAPVADPDEHLARLADAIDLRQTNRRRFDDEQVPAEVARAILAAASAEDAEAALVTRPQDRIAISLLSQRADEIENADPAYRAELRAWTTDDPARVDGVPSFAVPLVDGRARDDVPIRDFDTRGMGELPATTASNLDQCLLLIGALEDHRMAWLRTGEALERVLLEITRRGFVASFFTQVIEVARTNVLLRQELRLRMHPHVLLRIGRAERTPATRRRRLVDVLDIAG